MEFETFADGQEGAVEVDPHHFPPEAHIGLVDCRGLRDAGVRYADLHRAARLDRRGDAVDDGSFFGDVHAERVDARAARGFQHLHAAACDGDFGAFGGKCPRDGEADPGAASGDERVASLVLHGVPPVCLMP